MSSKHVWWRPLSWWRFLKPCVQAVVLLDSWQVQDQEVPGGSVWAPYSLEPTNVWDPASKRSWNPDQGTWTWQKGPKKRGRFGEAAAWTRGRDLWPNWDPGSPQCKLERTPVHRTLTRFLHCVSRSTSFSQILYNWCFRLAGCNLRHGPT